ncbi:MAG: hypothetical protein P8X90_21735 [Desulfobacterales bacterium]
MLIISSTTTGDRLFTSPIRPRRNRSALFVPPILACVSEIGHNRRQTGGSGAAGGIGQQQKLQHMIGRRRRGRLNQKNVAALKVFLNRNIELMVREVRQFASPHPYFEA